jgi:hypothetical protein
MSKYQYFVGINPDGSREVFPEYRGKNSMLSATRYGHDNGYVAVIGPHNLKAGAELMAKPHAQYPTASDADKAAKRKLHMERYLIGCTHE